MDELFSYILDQFHRKDDRHFREPGVKYDDAWPKSFFPVLQLKMSSPLNINELFTLVISMSYCESEFMPWS